jgi:hypothetical protein
MQNSTNSSAGNQHNSIGIAKVKVIQNPDTKTVAFIDVHVGPVYISGFSLIRTKNGLWFAPPSRLSKDKDGNKKNFPIVEMPRHLLEALSKKAIARYQVELRELTQSESRRAPAAGYREPPEELSGALDDHDIPF